MSTPNTETVKDYVRERYGAIAEQARSAGFTRVDLDLQGASKKFIAQWGEDPRVADFLVSAIITAWKP